MIELVDIGVNLTNSSLLRDLDGVMRRALDAGVRQMVVTGTSIDSSREAQELCKRYPQRLVATCGIHPHHASDWDASCEAELESLARFAVVRAIGETGLDFNRNYSPREAQEAAFHGQLEIAARMARPVFCHQRDAHDRFVAILREYRDRLGKIVVHCFTDDRTALFDYLDLDCHIGITGWICDERRGLELRRLVCEIPGHRLMLETDAPYLLPRDLRPKPASRINEPANLPHILAAVARHRAQPATELAAVCLATSREFFAL